jgi:NAD(P)-dependent dehydrogenase (short-subunit alcohol dehydrogenase family)
MDVLDGARKILDLFSLEGKKALVTGGSQGIGRGYALALAGAGADVAIIDINDKSANSTVGEIKSLGRKSIYVKCDVTKKDQVASMVQTVVDEFGRLDIGVNNAGTGRLGDDLTISQEDWDFVIDLDLTAVFLCAQAEAQQMVKQGTGGKIINTASMSGTIANANASYNAAKAGVMHLTKTLAAEWGQYNIYVNSLSPTYLFSPMHGYTPIEIRDAMRDLHPLGWFMRPEDLYGPVVFFASDASNYVTGRDLIVDGGHTVNVWVAPPARPEKPRVSREEEVLQLKHDLDVLGIKYDEDGVAYPAPPGLVEYLKKAFGKQE